MTLEAIYSLAAPLVLLQFLAVSWIVNREMHAPDDQKQSVISLPDVLNIVSLFATIAFAIILPVVTGLHLWISRMVLGGAYVLIGFHPLTVAAHYRLWRRNGKRSEIPERDYCLVYANREELALALAAGLLAVLVAVWIGAHGCT